MFRKLLANNYLAVNLSSFNSSPTFSSSEKVNGETRAVAPALLVVLVYVYLPSADHLRKFTEKQSMYRKIEGPCPCRRCYIDRITKWAAVDPLEQGK